MAKKIYRNKTEIVQGIYDESMSCRYVIPGGTIELEEKAGTRHLDVLTEVVEKKSKDK